MPEYPESLRESMAIDTDHLANCEMSRGRWAPVAVFDIYPLRLEDWLTRSMVPNFTLMPVVAIVFGIAMPWHLLWRLDGPDMLAFTVLAGLFNALTDFVSCLHRPP